MALEKIWVKEIIEKEDDFFPKYNDRYITDEARNDINCYYKVISDYKDFLKHLADFYPEKFRDTPKGYPYYWIGFLLFKIKNYEQAIFYLDAALAEDKHYMNEIIEEVNGKPKYKWMTSGAALFFYQHEFMKTDTSDYTFFNTPELKNEFEKILKDFNSNNMENYTIDFNRDIKGFVNEILQTDNTALITTFYSFVMEKCDIDEAVKFKSKYSGTIEPMILHLVKGSLLFESMLKIRYHTSVKHKILNKPSQRDRNNIYITLANILHDPDFKTKMGYTKNIDTSESNINNINIPPAKFSIEDSFTCTAKIRNKSTHSLCWDDAFVRNYDQLYKHIIYSICYFIYKEYINS